MRQTSAEQATEITQHDNMVAFNDFTLTGSFEALPGVIAQRACERHQNKQPFQIHLLTGASVDAITDGVLSAADAVSRYAPYQTSTDLREKINQSQVRFIDLHLNEMAQMVNYGFFSEIGVTVIEASVITPDGRVWLSNGIGNALAQLLWAKRVIIELSHYHNPYVMEFADVIVPGIPPRRNGIPIFHAMDRVDGRYMQTNPKKVAAVVGTELSDAENMADETNPVSQQVANNVVTSLLAEMAHKRIPAEFLPLQSGVGNINNAVIARLGESPNISPLMVYPEALQEPAVHLLGTGRIAGANASSLTISTPPLQKTYDNVDFFVSWIMLRPQGISNSPGIIRRLGAIAFNVGLEFDIYGHANSTHVTGTDLMNGISGSGDFERNTYLSIFTVPSTAKDGKISTIAPMYSYVGHNEHSVKAIVTEQGVADLRRLSSVQRAHIIIDNCAHPPYQDYLRRYPEKTPDEHIHHGLSHAFGLHCNLLETGSMLG